MIVDQMRWTAKGGWGSQPPAGPDNAADLVLLFGSNKQIHNPEHLDHIRAAYPSARFLGCSTAGEICDTMVTDDSLVIEGERRSEMEAEEEGVYRSERTYGRFSRVIARGVANPSCRKAPWL